MSEYDFSQPLERKCSYKWENEGVVDGHRVLPMSVADMDFVSPHEVTAVFREFVDGGEFGYGAYPADHPEVFAEWQKRRHGWELHPHDVIIANGLLTSLTLMLDAISAPGDGIIIFTPVYQNFFDTISGTGRVPQCCELVCDENDYWRLDVAAYEALCGRPDIRAVVICNPHNPVGRVWITDNHRPDIGPAA